MCKETGMYNLNTEVGGSRLEELDPRVDTWTSEQDL